MKSKSINSPMIISSDINNPFLNLAIENWVFKNWLKNNPILMLWQNKSSLVIGRAQNPWLECNLALALKDNIPIVRRQSGGGTVFHDFGNINFTFLMPNNLYDKKAHLDIIILALKKLGITSFINERNDIITSINGNHFKLSGSAYRETKHTSFHHGTLLVKSDLELLKKYLHHKQDKNIEAKGVPSVRSKVTSIQHIDPSISIEDIMTSIRQSFSDKYSNSNQDAYCFNYSNIKHNTLILDHAHELQQWEWVYAKSLPFSYSIDLNVNSNHCTINLDIKHGKIENITLNGIHSYDIPSLFLFLSKQPNLMKNEIDELKESKKLSLLELKILTVIEHLFV